MSAEIIAINVTHVGQDELISESALVALTDQLPPEMLLTVAAGALRNAFERRDDSGEDRPNRNCLICAKRCIERLLDLDGDVRHE